MCLSALTHRHLGGKTFGHFGIYSVDLTFKWQKFALSWFAAYVVIMRTPSHLNVGS